MRSVALCCALLVLGFAGTAMAESTDVPGSAEESTDAAGDAGPSTIDLSPDPSSTTESTAVESVEEECEGDADCPDSLACIPFMEGARCGPRWMEPCEADEACDTGSELACREIPGIEGRWCAPKWAGAIEDGCRASDDLLCGNGNECVEPRRCVCPDELALQGERLDEADFDPEDECSCGPPTVGLCRFVAPSCSSDDDCPSSWSCERTDDVPVDACFNEPERWIGCPDFLGGERCVPNEWELFVELRDTIGRGELEIPDSGVDEDDGLLGRARPTDRGGCHVAAHRPFASISRDDRSVSVSSAFGDHWSGTAALVLLLGLCLRRRRTSMDR